MLRSHLSLHVPAWDWSFGVRCLSGMLEVLASVPSPATNKQIQQCLFTQRLEITQEFLPKLGGRLTTGPLLEELYSCLELDHITQWNSGFAVRFFLVMILTISLTVHSFLCCEVGFVHFS